MRNGIYRGLYHRLQATSSHAQGFEPDASLCSEPPYRRRLLSRNAPLAEQGEAEAHLIALPAGGISQNRITLTPMASAETIRVLDAFAEAGYEPPVSKQQHVELF